MSDFIYSVLRVVPDPIKDEAVNIGIVVVEADGARGDLVFTERFKTRVGVLRRDFPVAATVAAVEDLKVFLGLEPNVRFGSAAVAGSPQARLEAALRYLEGQLQLTTPRPYQAESLEAAVHELYQRYVTKKLPRPVDLVTTQPTASQMRNRIWATVQKWRGKNLTIEKGGFLRGQKARHPADFVIRNGRPRGAIFALPASEDERALTFLYRDSLPTIANDMGEDFRILGVLPDSGNELADRSAEFVAETRSLLDSYERVEVAELSRLDEVEDRFVTWLL